MHLFCTAKGCANVVEKPDHRKGFLLLHCERCERTTDHAPCPPPGKFLPPAGHRGIFNNATQFKSKKR